MSNFNCESYNIAIRPNYNVIQLYAGINIHKGSAYFYDDISNKVSKILSNGNLLLYFPMSKFSQIVDLLRNEDPILVYLLGNASNGTPYIGTSYEPVGEEEGN